MTNSYGPWATTIDAGRNPQLSAFWRRRLTMLVPASQTSPLLSRRNLLWLGAAGVLTAVLPTFRVLSAAAGEEKSSAEGQKTLPGRIFVGAVLKTGPGEDHEYSGYVAVDPETGRWEKLLQTESVGPVRVSPDGTIIPFNKYIPRPGASKTADPSDRMISELWTYDIPTGQATRVPGFGSGVTCWSADSRQMVVNEQHFFEANVKSRLFNAGNRRWVAWLVSHDGTQGSRLPFADTDYVEDWSSDGKWFLLSADGLYRVRPDGTGRVRLCDGGFDARFSPDGRRIVYTASSRGKSSIGVVNADCTGDHVILRGEGLESLDAACWSPDGRWLAVLWFKWQVKDGKKSRGGGNPADQDFRLELMDPEGNNRRPLDLTDAKPHFLGGPDWR
jgi:hypothetical protein